MKTGKNYKFWFATGSQDLYGDACLKNVAEHSRIIVDGLNKSGLLPYEVVWKPTLITNAVIRKTFNEANADEECAGVITWMHTFSPAKSWILGLQEYRKPLMHFHTQFNEEIPYDTIDMDFMNENQSAHGDREYGHIVSRMGIERKIVVGHWQNPDVVRKIAQWMVTAVGVMESSHIRVCRFGDNMNNVAVTEGDKVEAQIKFGWEIDHYNVNDLAEYVDAVSAADIKNLTDEYYSRYKILTEGRDEAEFRRHVEVQAGIEIGMEKFLEERDYHAIVTHFGMLGGLRQLPGLAIQRLIWIWRRGRLEDGGDGPSDEDHGFQCQGCEGYVFHGGLYIQFRAGQGGHPAGAYAGGMPERRGRRYLDQGMPAVHGQQGGSGEACVYVKDRSCCGDFADRSGQSFPPDHQCGRLQEGGEADAEASGRNCILDTAA